MKHRNTNIFNRLFAGIFLMIILLFADMPLTVSAEVMEGSEIYIEDLHMYVTVPKAFLEHTVTRKTVSQHSDTAADFGMTTSELYQYMEDNQILLDALSADYGYEFFIRYLNDEDPSIEDYSFYNLSEDEIADVKEMAKEMANGEIEGYETWSSENGVKVNSENIAFGYYNGTAVGGGQKIHTAGALTVINGRLIGIYINSYYSDPTQRQIDLGKKFRDSILESIRFEDGFIKTYTEESTVTVPERAEEIESEARKQAFNDTLKQTGGKFLSGAISGLVMGGIATIIGLSRRRKKKKQEEADNHKPEKSLGSERKVQEQFSYKQEGSKISVNQDGVSRDTQILEYADWAQKKAIAGESTVVQMETMDCRKCGKVIPADSIYCPKCGQKLQ